MSWCLLVLNKLRTALLLVICLGLVGQLHAADTAKITTPVAAPPDKAVADPAAPPAAVPDVPTVLVVKSCKAIFTPDDPRLFEFVKTRKAVDFTHYQGKKIRAISYITLPVFNEKDPREDNFLYRFVNRIHMLTRTSPIRKQLLFREGDELKDELVRESERALRSNGYLYDAMVLPGEICGDEIDLLVVVRDIWTLQPDASFSHAGGESHSSFGITEENLFGLGHSLDLAYTKDADRTGVAAAYKNDHLIDGHTGLRVGHKKNSDGQSNNISLIRPFYALDTPWSAGIGGGNETLHETLAAGGVITNAYYHHTEDREVFAGISNGVHDKVVHRWRFGYTRNVDAFRDQDPAYTVAMPADRVLAWTWAEFSSVEDNFWSTSNYTQMFRNEDVQLGTTWTVRLGTTSRALGSTEDAYLGDAAYSHTISFGKSHLLLSRATADYFVNASTGDLENTLVGYAANYQKIINDNNRWNVTLQLDAGRDLTEDRELTAGGESHLRGYPNQWQRGDRRAVLNIARRHFYNVHVLNLFRLGAAAFIDIGRAWDTTNSIVQSEKVLANVGVGLRVSSSKARASHVIHMNLATPLVDRAAAGDYQWSVYAEEKF